MALEEMEAAVELINVGSNVFGKYGLILSIELKEVGAE